MGQANLRKSNPNMFSVGTRRLNDEVANIARLRGRLAPVTSGAGAVKCIGVNTRLLPPRAVEQAYEDDVPRRLRARRVNSPLLGGGGAVGVIIVMIRARLSPG